MDIRQLEAFTATVECKSFSKAAEKLYLSQPTISSHVHSLEKELHTKLIRRTTKEFDITPAGQRLYEYAISILELRKKAIEELSGQKKKALYLGASSVPSLYILPRLLGAYHQQAPDIRYHTYHSDSIDIIQRVSDGILDVGLVGTEVLESDCIFKPFATDELVIAAPNTPYYQEFLHSDAPLTQLLKEPFIIRENDSGTRMETEHFLQQMHISMEDLNIIASVNAPESLKNCIRHGLGISILSRKTVESSGRAGELLIFPLGEHGLIRNLYIVYSKGEYLPDTTREFIHFVEKFFKF